MDEARPTTRAEQREHTQARITAAVGALIQEQGQFTIAEVADRSGVSPATIYRHYPDREALVQAVAYEDTYRRDADPQTVPEWRELLHDVWRWQEDNYDRVVAVSSTPAGREMRAARIRDRERIISQNLERLGIDPNTPAGRRMLLLWSIVPSSRTYLEFREVFGLDAAEGSELVTWAVTALIRATQEGWEIGDGLD